MQKFAGKKILVIPCFCQEIQGGTPFKELYTLGRQPNGVQLFEGCTSLYLLVKHGITNLSIDRKYVGETGVGCNMGLVVT